MSHAGLQTGIDTCYDFFDGKELEVNPGKSVVMCFVSPRSADFHFTCNFRGLVRELVRYLCSLFGDCFRQPWKVGSSKRYRGCSLTLGTGQVQSNCTIGRRDTKHLIDLFDSLVASIYRFGLGAWALPPES
jgi:hypothetical protein